MGCMVGMGIGLGLAPVLTDQIGVEKTARFFAPVRTVHGGPAAAVVEQLDRVADIMG
ncbi:MAG: hypothetical protein ACI8RZ_003991 [Myxococcota bacterium]|jgi:hypothetical protein